MKPFSVVLAACFLVLCTVYAQAATIDVFRTESNSNELSYEPGLKGLMRFESHGAGENMLALRERRILGRKNAALGDPWLRERNEGWGSDRELEFTGRKSFRNLMVAFSGGNRPEWFLREFEEHWLSDGNGLPTEGGFEEEEEFTEIEEDGAWEEDGRPVDEEQVSAVPVPPSLVLLGSAIFGLGFVAHRRRRTAA